jgi:hypothetical protein
MRSGCVIIKGTLERVLEDTTDNSLWLLLGSKIQKRLKIVNSYFVIRVV